MKDSDTPTNAESVGLRTSEAPFAAVTGYAARREVNYAEAEKVQAVTEIFGMRLVAHADMPPDQCHLVQNGRCVGKIVMPPCDQEETNKMAETQSGKAGGEFAGALGSAYHCELCDTKHPIRPSSLTAADQDDENSSDSRIKSDA